MIHNINMNSYTNWVQLQLWARSVWKSAWQSHLWSMSTAKSWIKDELNEKREGKRLNDLQKAEKLTSIAQTPESTCCALQIASRRLPICDSPLSRCLPVACKSDGKSMWDLYALGRASVYRGLVKYGVFEQLAFLHDLQFDLLSSFQDESSHGCKAIMTGQFSPQT